jgi:phosphoribosylaminoimidazolecarboxamide formyltransferase/IMP cyclohydrolase
VRRAIISVWDKSGLVEFGRSLHGQGFELLSTSGSAEALRSAGLPVTEVSDYTGAPEMLGGRVKTLHPRIAGGILTTRKDPAIDPIDVVVCNLYPFEDGLRRGAGAEELVELIDIGGVTLLRAGAKNHAFVTVVPEPRYYPLVLQELESSGTVGTALRLRLALRAFEITSHYDAVIAGHLRRNSG